MIAAFRIRGIPDRRRNIRPEEARALESALPAEFARREASFFAEEPYEMAGVGVAHLETDFDDAHLRFTKLTLRAIRRETPGWLAVPSWSGEGDDEMGHVEGDER